MFVRLAYAANLYGFRRENEIHMILHFDAKSAINKFFRTKNIYYLYGVA